MKMELPRLNWQKTRQPLRRGGAASMVGRGYAL